MDAEIELSELIDSIDILEYISQFTDFTEKNGEYWALSPLKEENTPSFSVRRETNSFYDFASGIGGNVFTFVRYYFKCGNAAAVKKLQEYAGVTGKVSRPRQMAVCEVAKRYKPPIKGAVLKNNSHLDDNYMVRFEKTPEKLAVWEREGISRASLDKFQVCYDRFSDRIVYPIRNPDGKIVNIGGRTLDTAWKEKKLRKYTYFSSWDEMRTIYGLAENRESILEKGEIILFEGAKSVLLADTWGICNTGAILTSHLNPNQMELLAKPGVRVVFALDKEVDIRKDRNIRRLKQFVGVEYLHDTENLLSDKDSPVDKGFETFKKLYEGRFVWQ